MEDNEEHIERRVIVYNVHERLDALEDARKEDQRELKAQTKILTHIARTQKGIGGKIDTQNEKIDEHMKDDEKRLVKLENDVGWIKRVGIWAFGALGLSHVFKV